MSAGNERDDLLAAAGGLDGSLDGLRRLDEYKATAVRLFPQLPAETVETWSLVDHDALAASLLLDALGGEFVVLDVGTFIGTSAFFFAGHPAVTHVLSNDPNPRLVDEIGYGTEHVGLPSVDEEALGDLRVFDVARAALAEFPAENDNVELREGVVGSDNTPIPGAPAVERVSVPGPDDEPRLFAFVDALHSKDAVHADLEAIFAANPQAIVALDDCRFRWGAFVQAGVVSFMEASDTPYRFRLLADVAPALARSNLGVVYGEEAAADVEAALERLARRFSDRLDLLRLARREEDLIEKVAALRNELDEQEKVAVGPWRARAAKAERQRESWEERATIAERQREAWEDRAEQATAKMNEVVETLRTLTESTSWRLTKPLRSAGRLFKR